MKKVKAIILGPQCSGKTTIKKYLSKNTDIFLSEEDEIFTELNGGNYPHDLEHKENVLRKKLEEKVEEMDNVIYLTSYGNLSFFRNLVSRGFKIIQLTLDIEEFNRRNIKRMKEEGYKDASEWVEGIYAFHKLVKDEGMVDISIDASQPTETVVKEIVDFLGV